jgi:uncharacterized protein (TIGR03435 family)
MGTAASAVWIAGIAAHLFVLASAQSPDKGPVFEVVSIKRNAPSPGFNSSGITWRPDGGLTITNVPLATIISRAYQGALPGDMVNLPAWALSEPYDVRATSSLPRATPDDQIAMLRAMLADRFKLVVHMEKREQATYDLVLARSNGRLGSGMTLLDVDCARVVAERTAAAEAARLAGTPPPRVSPPDLTLPPSPCTLRTVNAVLRDRAGDKQGRLGDLLEGEGTLNDLATTLRFTMVRLVVNKTGLPGSYRMRMNFDMRSGRGAPTVTAPDADAPPSIFTAIQEQLGLKLETSHSDIDALVIDHVERATEN